MTGRRVSADDPWLAGKEDTASENERNPLTGAEADFAARRVGRAGVDALLAAAGDDSTDDSPDAAA